MNRKSFVTLGKRIELLLEFNQGLRVSGSSLIKEKMDLDVQVSKLKMSKANYQELMEFIKQNPNDKKVKKLKELVVLFDVDIESVGESDE